jgi:macrolide transport system ATP-binding/permease protein
MRSLRARLRRLGGLFRRNALEAGMKAEMQAHLDGLTERNLAAGMSPDEARHAALREFGGMGQFAEQARDERRSLWAEQLGQDLRYAVRSLAKSPSFTLTAVVTLALGIGVNVALFFVYDLVSLRPLPVKDPDGLVRISGLDARERKRSGFDHAEYIAYRDANRTLEGLLAFHEAKIPIRRTVGEQSGTGAEGGEIGAFTVEFISGNYFDVLGGTLQLGRTFQPGELMPGAAETMVVSHWFWETCLQRDPHVLGTTLRFRDQVFTVIGVASAEFSGQCAIPPAAWLPLGVLGNPKGNGGPAGAPDVSLIGRLRPGVTEAQAVADLGAIALDHAAVFPGETAKVAVALERGMHFLKFNSAARVGVSTMSLGFVMVLVIACTNVANLLLARGVSRQSEIGVRLTLGAGRGRIVRQLMTENVLLCALGAILGLVLAVWTLQVLHPTIMGWLPEQLPMDTRRLPFFDLTPDRRVIGFTAALMLGATLVAGLLPALQTVDADVIAAIRNDGTTFGRRMSPSRMRRWLIISQVTVCLTLLSCAGVLARTYATLRRDDVGFDARAIFAVGVTPNSAIKDRPMAFRLALDALRALPGVGGAAMANRAPFYGVAKQPRLRIGGIEEEMAVSFVTGDFFATFGIPLQRGRTFREVEQHSAARAVIVSESLARQLWPRQEAVGKILAVAETAWAPRDRPAPPEAFRECEVIGVAADVVVRLDDDDRRLFYLPFPLEAAGERPVFVHPRSNSSATLVEIVRQANAVGVGLQFGPPLSVRREQLIVPQTILASFGAGLAILALVLAVVGLYGVMAFAVNQRVREIGIRMALGATAGKVVALFVRQGMRLVAFGLAFGLIGGRLFALALGKVTSGQIDAFNAVIFGVVTLLFALIALFACWLPSRRATKVNPMVALRAE